MELGDPDASGRRRPVVTGTSSRMSCDYVLLAAGQYSDLEILPSEWQLRAGRAYRLDQPLNVWLAGDVATGAGTVAHAVGNGRSVASNILGSLVEKRPEEKDIGASVLEVVSEDDIRLFQFPMTEPLHDRQLPVSERVSHFVEVNTGLADTAEAERCFSCGHCTACDTCLNFCPEGIISRKSDGYAIDGDYCKGCGICVRECPRHAMQMTSEGYRSKPL